MTAMDINYQLVPPSNHRADNADRSIKMFNNHFISGLCSVDGNFHFQFRERLIQQATISLNQIQQSRLHPHLAAHTHIYGEFDSNQIPLDPPGTRVVIHDRPKDWSSWATHGEPNWYILPAMEHYR